MRKTILLVTLLAAGTAGTARADGGGGDFGLGLQVGAPTGISGKYYIDRFALQFGVGVVERGWDDGTHLHVDALWHPVILTRQAQFVMPFYAGVGLRALEDDNDDFYCRGNVCYDNDDDFHAGVRVPVGVLMDFTRVPLDLFLELVPTIDFVYDDDEMVCFPEGCFYDDDDRFSLYASLGARYYF